MYMNGTIHSFKHILYVFPESVIYNPQSWNLHTKSNKAQKQIIMLQIKKVQKCWQLLTPKDLQTGWRKGKILDTAVMWPRKCSLKVFLKLFRNGKIGTFQDLLMHRKQCRDSFDAQTISLETVIFSIRSLA